MNELALQNDCRVKRKSRCIDGSGFSFLPGYYLSKRFA
jgi:hypothetical protein